MSVKIIEAEYHITSVQFWEIKHIEGWPTDHEDQPRDLDTANDHHIKWGLLFVQWESGDKFEEYEPTGEQNGQDDDHKWPDDLYYDGERVLDGYV
jgi:hypothetical protein